MHRYIVQTQFNNGLLYKTCFLAIAIQQSKLPFGTRNCQYQTRQTGTTADIQPFSGPQMRQNSKTIQQMMADHLLRVADRRQVIDFIPLLQQLQVIQQFLLYFRA